MKFKLHILTFFVFCLFSATKCIESEDYILNDIELNHFDNSGAKMIKSTKPIKKEAYVIGIIFIVKDYPFRNASLNSLVNVKKKPKVYTLYDFDEQHSKGSDVSDCLVYGEITYNAETNLILVFNKYPKSGTHSFRVEFECTDTTITKETTPIELY